MSIEHNSFHALVVKSTSPGSSPPSAAFSQEQLPAARFPHAQVLPSTWAFSSEARSQVHIPAGRARHEQRAPSTLFSKAALSQLQARADCLPHEQVAFAAHTQEAPSPELRPQQVDGTTMFCVYEFEFEGSKKRRLLEREIWEVGLFL